MNDSSLLTIFGLVTILTIDDFDLVMPTIAVPLIIHSIQFKSSSFNVLLRENGSKSGF